MKLNFAIIDDCRKDISIVAEMTEKYFSGNHHFELAVKEYDCGKAFLADYKKGEFDLVFIDICMNEIDGLELSSRLRNTDNDIVIIFMSTTTEYVFDTFKALPYGYLRKPVSFTDFSETMDRAMKKFTDQFKKITVRMPRYEDTVITQDIISVISDNHNTIIKTTAGMEIHSISTYQEIAKQLLLFEDFFECNRGIMVNLKYAVSANGSDIRMQDGTIYPVRKQDRKRLTLLLAKQISGKYKGGFFS